MALLRSLAFSIAASILATLAARRMLSVVQPPGSGTDPAGAGRTIVVVVPMLAGNSNNRIGWVKEDRHFHYALFGPRRTEGRGGGVARSRTQ